ncbi:MAG TPA: hypothetical protein VF116_20825 [Ktedonobacterales bacterium]
MTARDEGTGCAQGEGALDALVVSLARDGERTTALAARVPLAPSLAGGALERIVVRHTLPSGASWRHRHVVKWLLPEHGWLGAATHDTRIREAQLARSGLLDTLPRSLATPTRAVRIEGDPAAPEVAVLLMDDVSPYLVRHAIGGPAGRLTGELLALLDRLAQLHARFWCDPRLREPALGLVTPRDALLLAAPQTLAARIAAGDENPYLPLALRGWEAFFALAAPDDAAALEAVLRDPDPVLRAIAALPWTLTHGDVWAPNLGWLPPGIHRTPLRERETPTGGARHAPLRILLSAPSAKLSGLRALRLPSASASAIPSPGRCRGEPWLARPGGEDSRLLLLDWALAAAAPATYDPLWLCGSTHALDPVAVLAAYRPRLEHHLRARGIALAPAVWRDLAHAGYLRTVLTCGEAFGRAAAEAPAGAARRRAEARVRWWARRAARAAGALVGQ